MKYLQQANLYRHKVHQLLLGWWGMEGLEVIGQEALGVTVIPSNLLRTMDVQLYEYT